MLNPKDLYANIETVHQNKKTRGEGAYLAGKTGGEGERGREGERRRSRGARRLDGSQRRCTAAAQCRDRRKWVKKKRGG